MVFLSITQVIENSTGEYSSKNKQYTNSPHGGLLRYLQPIFSRQKKFPVVQTADFKEPKLEAFVFNSKVFFLVVFVRLINQRLKVFIYKHQY